MNADTVIRWFLPKEERFHELLGRDTQNLLRAGRLFAEIAHAQNLEERRVKSVHLKAVEHEGDQITRLIFEALNSSFITPFDREDIRSLAMALEIERMIREGRGETVYPPNPPWSNHSV